MNVRELIQRLMLMNQEAEVIARDSEGLRVVVEAEDVQETTLRGADAVQITPW